MKKWNKLLALLLAMVMALGCTAVAFADDEKEGGEKKETAATEGITILYTNDVHTYIDNTRDVTGSDGEESKVPGLRYSTVAALKDSYENVLLVDAGDHIQGTAYGQMDKGATITKLMNATGYDVATLGNHEFDYGMDGCMAAIEGAEFPYVSCNFYHEKDGKAGDSVLDSYEVFEVDGKKIAFVGITTPESFTSSTPAYFQDDKGNYIYGIAGGKDGADLYAAVQKAIDSASKEADYVIALGHLGVDPSSAPWTSKEVIANTTGLDAFIDGHSHTIMAMESVKDKSGETVVLSQTGCYLGSVGKMTIADDGTISSELLTDEELAEVTPDEDVKALEEAWAAEIDKKLGEVVGHISATLDNYDNSGDEPVRLVRKQETNTGDFAADALYYLFDNMDMDVDVAVMNGGGVRNKAITGDISYKTCKEIHTFGNVACLQTVTGQQILDALEWGAKDAAPDGSVENGGFLQVSGLKYTIDLSVPSTVQKDEKGVWTGGPTGEYRVQDVQVLNNETGEYEDLDLSAKYNLAGYNYTLRDMGDGFNMFAGAVNVLDYVMEDYMVLANYVKSFENGEVAGYEDVNGDGRITLKGQAADAKPDPDEAKPEDTKPEDKPEATVKFSDVADGVWYTDYVYEMAGQQVVGGYNDGTFKPEKSITWGEALKMVLSMNGYTEGKGDGTHWASGWLAASLEKAIIVSTKQLDTPITRVEFCELVCKAMGLEESTADNPFTDTDNGYVILLANAGVVNGKSEGVFAPDSPLKRCEVCKILVEAAANSASLKPVAKAA